MKTQKVKRSKNPITGIVHAVNGKKTGPLRFYQTVCGYSTGLAWTTANNEEVTCLKCKSRIPSLRK